MKMLFGQAVSDNFQTLWVIREYKEVEHRCYQIFKGKMGVSVHDESPCILFEELQ